MGRKKIADKDKAVAKSITFSRAVFNQLDLKVEQSGSNYSKVIDTDMAWFSELMSLTGLRLEGMFSIEEIQALLSVADKLDVEVGQVASLKDKLSRLFLPKYLDAKGLLEKDEVEELERLWNFSSFRLRKKLVELAPHEAIWLYEKINIVARNNRTNDIDFIKFTFRCEG